MSYLRCTRLFALAMAGLLLHQHWYAESSWGEAAEAKSAWQAGQQTELKGAKITLSQPVLVMRDKGYLWFPTLIALADGKLLAKATNYPDTAVKQSTCLASWSADEGLTWSKPIEGIYGDQPVRMANGDELLMPYHLHPEGKELVAEGVLIPRGKQELLPHQVRIAGLPKPVKIQSADLNLAGFWFNGQAVTETSGGFLATIHGYFEGDKRLNLVNLESTNGTDWKFRSIIAPSSCALEGADGPCESATARLKDGRLMCVFRLGAELPLGQVFSSDEGKTWTEPQGMPGPRSVQPALVVLEDGALVLTTGRPGVWCWIDLTGKGESWQSVDLLANHNEFATADAIKVPQSVSQHQTSSYTQVIALSPTRLLVIYDRMPHGWSEPPNETEESNSIWVVQVNFERE